MLSTETSRPEPVVGVLERPVATAPTVTTSARTSAATASGRSRGRDLAARQPQRAVRAGRPGEHEHDEHRRAVAGRGVGAHHAAEDELGEHRRDRRADGDEHVAASAARVPVSASSTSRPTAVAPRAPRESVR